MDTNHRPHAVCISFPAQSHMKGVMKLAKLLNSRGFYITFVNTEFNQSRLVKANGSETLESLPNFKFETMVDGLVSSNPDATQDITLLFESITKNFQTLFRELITKLNDKSCFATPPVTCIVADGFMPFSVTVGKELGIPVFLYCTIAASRFYQYCTLLEKDESDLINDRISRIGNTLLKEIPNFIQTCDPEKLNFLKEVAEAAVNAAGFGIHTFDALEQDVLDALSFIVPHIYTIGPLQLLLNRASNINKLDSLGYNLWKEESECLNWLDSKEPGSVLYVNFGSITVISQESLVEFAWGLANSDKYFLWIVRPDLVIGDSAILPYEFTKQTSESGFVSSWCSQEEILNHRSIAGFLTHCGWNSTMESLTAGVPMICWPYFADQHTNCRFICDEWEVGMEIDSDVKSENVEKLIRELMSGEKGKKIKDKAVKWKKFAAEATSTDGSSSLNLDKLVNLLLSE